MKRYTLSCADSFTHKPEYPERTATKSAGTGMNFDVVVQVWPSRGAMARTIRMQQQREHRAGDWRPFVALTDGEGY